MKIGIYTSLDDGKYSRFGNGKYEKIREHGFSCIDFNMADTDAELYNISETEAKKILLNEKQLAEKSGVKISQVHGPWRWPAKDFSAEDRRERAEKMKKSLYMCSILGCENWVVHPIMPFGVEDAETENAQKTWDMNIEFMNDILKTAKEYGITVCLENMPMPKFSLAAPERILEFVKTIDDDNFKICLDTGHVSVFENLSLGGETRRLGKYIKVLHVHDNLWGMDLHLPPYYGIADWGDFASALEEIGFDGSFSLETNPPAKLPDDIFEQMCVCYAKIAENIVKLYNKSSILL